MAIKKKVSGAQYDEGSELPPDLNNALTTLKAKVIEEQRANDLMQEAVDEAKKQTLLMKRRERWIEELASQTQSSNALVKGMTDRITNRLDIIEATMREVQQEQAEVNNHVLDFLTRVKDALLYILTRMNGDKRGKEVRARLEEVPSDPEDREEVDSLRKQLRARQRSLNRMMERQAKGDETIKLVNDIDDTQGDIARIKDRLSKIS